MCILHKYTLAGVQFTTSPSGLRFMRVTNVCTECAKLSHIIYDTFDTRPINVDGDGLLWEPKLDITAYDRDIKLKKLLKNTNKK